MYLSGSRRLILSVAAEPFRRLDACGKRQGIMSIDHFPGSPRLVVLSPEHLRGQVLDIRDENVLVGRGRNPRFVLDDPRVSRTHAAIRREGGGAVIEDLGSAGGTTINGVPATAATQ